MHVTQMNNYHYLLTQYNSTSINILSKNIPTVAIILLFSIFALLSKDIIVEYIFMIQLHAPVLTDNGGISRNIIYTKSSDEMTLLLVFIVIVTFSLSFSS